MNAVVDRTFETKGTKRRGLLGTTLGFFVGFAAVSLYGATGPELKEALGISGTLAGVLVGFPQLTGSLARIPGGAWVDTTGGKKPFLVYMLLSLAGLGGLTGVIYFYYPEGFSMTLYPVLLLLAALAGFGVATFSIGIPMTAYWYPEAEQGWALGAYAGFGNIAPGLFTFLVPVLLEKIGLLGSYLAWFFFLLAGIIVFSLISVNAPFFQLWEGVARGHDLDRTEAETLAREPGRISEGQGQEIFPSGNVRESLKMAAGVWRTWPLVVLYFTTFGGFLALTTWTPIYWQGLFDVSTSTAGLLGGILFSVFASLIRVPGGLLADRIGGIETAVLSLSALLAGAAIMFTVTEAFVVALGGEVLIAAGMGVNNAAVFRLVPDYVPEAVGGASGWVGGLGAFGGFVVPSGMGWILDLYGGSAIGYARGFVVFVVLALICLGFVGLLHWKRPE